MKLTDKQKEVVERRYFEAGEYYYQRIIEPPYDMEEEMERVIAIGKQYTSHFVIDETNRFTYENMIKWVRLDDTMQALHPDTGEVIKADISKGIYIAGGLGSGKTLCIEIMNSYAGEINAIYMDHAKVQPFTFYPCKSFDIFREYQAGEEIGKYYNYRILSVDDLGAEPKLANYMGTRMNPIRFIIEDRGEKCGMVNVFTSNFPFTHEVIIDHYGERVASRLWSMCNYLTLKGTDRRKQL